MTMDLAVIIIVGIISFVLGMRFQAFYIKDGLESNGEITVRYGERKHHKVTIIGKTLEQGKANDTTTT